MRKILFIICSVLFFSCGENDADSNYTGRQTTYTLLQSSDFPVMGTVTFFEKKDGFVEIKIELEGTEGDISHPAHLHYGDVSTPNAEIAIMLTPVLGSTGESLTFTKMFVDETAITYDDIISFEGHIKVHLDGEANKHIILASGNIGGLGAKQQSNGRVNIAVCKSN